MNEIWQGDQRTVTVTIKDEAGNVAGSSDVDDVWFYLDSIIHKYSRNEVTYNSSTHKWSTTFEENETMQLNTALLLCRVKFNDGSIITKDIRKYLVKPLPSKERMNSGS